MVTPDPEVVMGQGRAPFRVADLVDLAQLVERLSSERRSTGPSIRKGNFAALCKVIDAAIETDIGD
jgi:hypothetical protein